MESMGSVGKHWEARESSCGERRPQEHAGAVQLRLASACRDAEHAANFFVRVAFHVVQDEHPARAGRERPDRLLEIDR